ncbi:DegV family protein [Mycoplasma sp. Ms02]|uniref:DegV family protein n=1 Tax=Mycoplasma sp. Ms02 TaxID=353851 RepID=UPI001C8AF7DD|nr:DegV family protein [Mycoplasma sp. Ms02]QZE12370.1 DegV family protein [Mycoplasma sp. Ms02]
MKKLGIIIDSFSGVKREFAESLGFGFLSLQSDIDKKIYYDGQDDSQEILGVLAKAKDYRTSLPRLDQIEDTITEFSNQYENVIMILISKNLSSTASHAEAFSNQFKNVFVLDNHFTGYQVIEVAQKLQDLYEQGMSISELQAYVEDLRQKTFTLIVPKNLDFLINGGRLTGAKKFIMTKIQMIPTIKYDGSASVSALRRSTKTAISKIFEKYIKTIGEENIKNYTFKWIHGIDDEINKEVVEQAQKHNIVLDHEQYTSTAVAIHCGPEAIAITAMPKL